MADLEKQRFNLEEFNRVISSFRKDSQSRHNPLYFRMKLGKLEAKWKECEALHWETLRAVRSDATTLAEYKEAYNNSEQLCEEYQMIFQQGIGCFGMEKPEPTTETIQQSANGLIANQSTSSAGGVSEEQNHSPPRGEEAVRLERIKIPKFDGKYEDWLSFKDMFRCLVHSNEHISDTQKMQYLKTAVGGTAEQVLRHLAVTASNYKTAWDLLTRRFENKRAIAHSMVKNFYNIESCSSRNADGIRKLLDTTNGFLYSMTNLDVDVLNTLMLYLLEEKLDMTSKTEWQKRVAEEAELPTIESFLEFLQSRIFIMESTQPNTSKSTKQVTLIAATQQKCRLCPEVHELSKCDKFLQGNTEKRREMAKSLNACFNCLRRGHSSKNCTSMYKCKQCSKNHHTLLHIEAKTQGNPNKTQVHYADGSKTDVLLATAEIKVRNRYGSLTQLRALIDQGAQRSMITERAAQRLGLPRRQSEFIIHGIGNSSIIPKGTMSINIKEKWSEEFINAEVMVIKGQITKLIPSKSLDFKPKLKIKEEELADRNFHASGNIDVLIGSDLYGTILENGLIKGKPTYQRTKLGWILSGPTDGGNDRTSTMTFISVAELDRNLTKFWEQEEIPENRMPTPEEENAEEHYCRYTKRGEDGRYTVRLPFAANPAKHLANNAADAIVQYEKMERQLRKDQRLFHEYNKCLLEYIELGHMEEVNPKVKVPCYYMPHHAVVKEDRTTTKVRVVFNASVKTTSGHSLNDLVMVGPRTQESLVEILMRWRFHPIVLTADIEKMYRQVNLHTKDRDYERIVFRPSENEIIRHYQMKTLTFGEASAQFQATRTLLQLAKDEEVRFPEAVKYLKRDFYVDDLLTGADTEADTTSLQNQMTRLLAMGGFKLRKWNSNSIRVLQDTEQTLNNSPEPIAIQSEAKPEATTKILGLHWISTEDNFTFSVDKSFQDDEKITKRMILSQVAKLFDPLGLLQPVVVTGKILIQELWVEKCELDKPISPELQKKWSNYVRTIKALNGIKIPRWVGSSASSTIELHGFCDASQLAIAAAIYVKAIPNDDKPPTVRLLIAKTKVAPVQTQSIPRLELCSAVFLIKLMNLVKGAITRFENTKVHFWTDSQDVLAWIRKHPSHWGTYIANRVSKVQTSSEVHQWHHINTDDNPADCATRGLTATQLFKQQIWWTGAVRIQERIVDYTASQPAWFANTMTCSNEEAAKIFSDDDDDDEFVNDGPFPLENHETANGESSNSTSLCSEYHQAARIEPSTSAATGNGSLRTTAIESPTSSDTINEDFGLQLLKRYSSLQRLLRVIARCRRWKHKQPSIPLNILEIREAKTICIKWSQNAFSDDIRAISKKQHLPKGSRLLQLNPYLDQVGILRVGGRLQKSNLCQAAKHPVILSPRCPLAKLIVRETHQITTLHGTVNEVSATLREQYWILNVQGLIKSTIHQCITCFKATAQSKQQLMGVLPRERVTPARAFCNTGIDFAGPIKIKWSSGRGSKTMKAYIAVFICLTTKAFHLELVSELTTKACIAAIKRFVSRRGKCQNIFSDNGTNFVGASRELKRDFDNVVKETKESLVHDEIMWHFIPPGSPHFGGLWEAGVKSTKRHLIRSIGEKLLNVEQMYTALAEIEACLNSRPLTPISNDPNDFEALTPGHFLVGRSMFAIPTPEKTGRNLRDKWEEISEISQIFWRRWQREYLTRLQERPKWLKPQANLQSGQLVLVKNENLPSTKWPLARIEEIHPGEDNLVRVVTLRFGNGNQSSRHINKLCPLPVPITTRHDEGTTENHERKQRTKEGARSNLSPWLYVLCFIACCIPTSTSHVTTRELTGGTYIEHIGQAQLQHGTLRLDLRIPWSEVQLDQIRLKAVDVNMTKLCEYQFEAAEEVHCDDLKAHLQEAINSTQHKIMTLRLFHSRSRRGLFGTLLTSVFGVNDEAYKDIENLSQNQKEIIHTTQQQGKLLVKALQTMNNTNSKIQQQFSKFTDQLNTRFQDLQQIRNKLKTIDGNYLKVQFLSSYLLAKNLVEELNNKYQSILNTIYTRRGILECLDPSDVIKAIEQTERMIPSNLQVSRIPTNLLDIKNTDDYMALSGYLMILDTTESDLIKVTAVPNYVRDNIFSSKLFQPSIFAVRVKQQHYFEVTEDDLKTAVRLNEGVLQLQASMSYNFNNTPNCIIKELYGLQQGSNCPSQTFRLNKPVWNQLYDRNSWIVTSPIALTVDAVCQTEEERIAINYTTLINVPRDCSLHTPEFTITPDLQQHFPPLKVWFKSEAVNFDIQSLPSKPVDVNISLIKSDETFSDFIQEANSLNDHFGNIEWKAIIKHQGLPIAGLLALVFTLLVLLFLWKRGTRCIPKKRVHRTRSSTSRKISTTEPAINWKDLTASINDLRN